MLAGRCASDSTREQTVQERRTLGGPSPSLDGHYQMDGSLGTFECPETYDALGESIGPRIRRSSPWEDGCWL
jgi:hypothetical protein